MASSRGFSPESRIGPRQDSERIYARSLGGMSPESCETSGHNSASIEDLGRTLLQRLLRITESAWKTLFLEACKASHRGG